MVKAVLDFVEMEGGGWVCEDGRKGKRAGTKPAGRGEKPRKLGPRSPRARAGVAERGKGRRRKA